MEYNLKADHEALKKQVKAWELKIDKLTNILEINPTNSLEYSTALEDLTSISEEMMAINI